MLKGLPGISEYTTKMTTKDGKYFITTIGEDGKGIPIRSNANYWAEYGNRDI